MSSLQLRLSRIEKAANIGDPFAWIANATDEELEERLRKLNAILQLEADAKGITTAELMAEYGA